MNWCSLPIPLEGDWNLFGPTMLVLFGAHTEGLFHLMRATNSPAYEGRRQTSNLNVYDQQVFKQQPVVSRVSCL